MNKDFIKAIVHNQQQRQKVPPNSKIEAWVNRLIAVLYPEHAGDKYTNEQAVEDEFQVLQAELCLLMDATKACADRDHKHITTAFFDQLPELYRLLNTDIEAIHLGDPAAQNEFEVIRSYPGFTALSYYRIAHALHQLDVPLLPRIITEMAHSRTGIDIHPGASIDEYFMIDHGTGVVIGETSIVGKNVKIYQGVTLGALSVDKNMAALKRHPTIGDNVVIYSGATILGGETVIGEGSVIGGNVWLTHSVASGSLVYHNPEITVVEGKYNKL